MSRSSKDVFVEALFLFAIAGCVALFIHMRLEPVREEIDALKKRIEVLEGKK